MAVEDAHEQRCYEEACDAAEDDLPDGESGAKSRDGSGETPKANKGGIDGEGRCPGQLVHNPTLTTALPNREDEKSPRPARPADLTRLERL